MVALYAVCLLSVRAVFITKNLYRCVGSGATRVSLKGRVSPLLQPSLFNIVESPIWDIKPPFGTHKAKPTDFFLSHGGRPRSNPRPPDRMSRSALALLPHVKRTASQVLTTDSKIVDCEANIFNLILHEFF